MGKRSLGMVPLQKVCRQSYHCQKLNETYTYILTTDNYTEYLHGAVFMPKWPTEFWLNSSRFVIYVTSKNTLPL